MPGMSSGGYIPSMPGMRLSLRTRNGGVSRTFAAGLALLSLALVACGGSSPVGDDRLTVVTAFYPLAEAARRVGGDHVLVTNLTPPGAEPHDLELTPDDLEAIAAADLVVYVGAGFQPVVEEAIGEAQGSVLDVLDHASTLPASEGGPADPHVWLDPTRYAELAAAIGTALARIDQTDASAFRGAAADFGAALGTLDDGFDQGLASCRTRLILVNHAAFGYLADAYDLEQVAITGVAPEVEPDPARLAELRRLAIADGVTTIFTEELVPPDVAETLAAEVGVGTSVLNPIEGLTSEQEDAGEDYLSLMRENLDALRAGLGCD